MPSTVMALHRRTALTSLVRACCGPRSRSSYSSHRPLVASASRKHSCIAPAAAGEFEKHAGCWMGWPDSGYLWRDGAGPAQEQYANIAKAISEFEPLTMFANAGPVCPILQQRISRSIAGICSCCGSAGPMLPCCSCAPVPRPLAGCLQSTAARAFARKVQQPNIGCACSPSLHVQFALMPTDKGRPHASPARGMCFVCLVVFAV